MYYVYFKIYFNILEIYEDHHWIYVCMEDVSGIDVLDFVRKSKLHNRVDKLR